MFAKMYKVEVMHKIAWTRWIRANTKGYWRVKFNTDSPDNYFFVDKDSADKFEAYVAQKTYHLKSRQSQ